MNRTVWTLLLALGFALPTNALADHTDWDDWYDGDVEVRVQVSRGEGAIYEPGESVRIEFESNEDAYHLVYGIDTDGYVRILFPRYWEDDGWVRADHKVKLRSRDLAWPADRWGSDGIVYVEAVASPEPFDWRAVGAVAHGDYCEWIVDGRPLRISGDPFLAFNDIHRRLFRDWDRAVFAVDYTYFYLGAHYDAPRYLGYEYVRIYEPPPHPRWSVSVRFGWHWVFGSHCARPVYVAYYPRGRHVVHHHVHHVDYPARPGYRPYVIRDQRRNPDDVRIKHRTRHRERDIVVRRDVRDRNERQVREVGRKDRGQAGEQPVTRSRVRAESKQTKVIREKRSAREVRQAERPARTSKLRTATKVVPKRLEVVRKNTPGDSKLTAKIRSKVDVKASTPGRLEKKVKTIKQTTKLSDTTSRKAGAVSRKKRP